MKKTLSMIIILLLVIVDQLTKVIMRIWLQPIETAPFIPGVIQFQYAENTGAAFSSMQNARWLFISLTTVVCIVMLVLMLMNRIRSGVVYTALTLIVAGGIGNLIDRVFLGYVVDFLEPTFVNFAIFNFADSLVTVGAVIWAGYLIYDIIEETKKEKKAKAALKEDIHNESL